MTNYSSTLETDTARGISKDTTLRVGIIGAGLMGRWHARAIKRAGGRLSAVTDINPEAARYIVKSHSGAESFSDIEQMLNRANLDVLHICTPPSTHYKIAELAIDAGLNLLIDKPLTQAAEGTERLFNRALGHGLLICPVHQFVFQDGVLRGRKFLSRIGRVIHMEGTICSAGGAGLADVGATGWSPLLNEIVADVLPHPLSLIQAFLPNCLPRENWMTARSGHGELRAFCETSGITLSIFISMNARPTECSFKIVGTDGTIHFDMFHGYAFIEPGGVSRIKKTIHPFDLALRKLSAAAINLGRRAIRWEPAYPGLQRLISLFYKAVQTNSLSPISREDTIAVARVRDLLIHDSGLFNEERPELA